MNFYFAIFDAAGQLVQQVPDKAQAVALAQSIRGTWQRQFSAGTVQSPVSMLDRMQHPSSGTRHLGPAGRQGPSAAQSLNIPSLIPEVLPLTGRQGFVVIEAADPAEQAPVLGSPASAQGEPAPAQGEPVPARSVEVTRKPSGVRIHRHGFTQPEPDADARKPQRRIVTSPGSARGPALRGPKLVSPEEDYLLPVVQALHQKPFVPEVTTRAPVSTRQHPQWDVNETTLKEEAKWQQRKAAIKGSQAPLRQLPKETKEAYETRLIKAAFAGNMTAFSQYMEAHKSQVHKVASVYVRSQADAEDVFSDTHNKVWGAIHAEDPDIRKRVEASDKPYEVFEYYVLSAAKNTSFNVNRKNKFRVADQLDEGTHEAANEGTYPLSSKFGLVPQDVLLIQAENQRQFELAFAKMQANIDEIIAAATAPQAAEIWASHCKGMTPNKIAKALDLPAGTVNSRLGRLRDKIKDEYGEEYLSTYLLALEHGPPKPLLNPAKRKGAGGAWKNPLAYLRKRSVANPAAQSGPASRSVQTARACIQRAKRAEHLQVVRALRSEALVLAFYPDVTPAEHHKLMNEINKL